MEIEFYKPTVLDIPQMQDLVKPEVDKGIILLRTEDEMATTIRSYIVVKVDGKWQDLQQRIFILLEWQR